MSDASHRGGSLKGYINAPEIPIGLRLHGWVKETEPLLAPSSGQNQHAHPREVDGGCAADVAASAFVLIAG